MANNWRYDFNCKDCGNLKYIKDEIRDGIYCTGLMNGKDYMHADDDYVVRCDAYQPRQISLFEGGTT